MELLNSKSRCFDSREKKIAWLFLRDSHIEYLLMYPRILNKLLNEYLFFMNSNFNRYNDRFNREIEKNIKLDHYITEHLICFERLNCSLEVSQEDTNEMTKFYDKLLKLVDRAIRQKYMHGKKFNEDEIKTIRDNNSRLIVYCPQDKITIFVPKKYFNIRNYLMKKGYPNVEYFYFEKFIVLEYHNCSKEFTSLDLWDVKRSCNGPMPYSLEIDSLKNNKMTIFFDFY